MENVSVNEYGNGKCCSWTAGLAQPCHIEQEAHMPSLLKIMSKSTIVYRSLLEKWLCI
jgi:hypothetical protein